MGLKFVKTSAVHALNPSSDYKCGQAIFYCENVQLITDSMGI